MQSIAARRLASWGRSKRIRTAVLLGLVGVATAGCAALVLGAAGGVAAGLDNIVNNPGSTVDTTYAADVPTVASMVSDVVSRHLAQSQFALTKTITKDYPDDREVELKSAQGSLLVLRVQRADEKGQTAARLQIAGRVDRKIKLIGADREDTGAATEFGQIIYKVRQAAADRKLKIIRDTSPAS